MMALVDNDSNPLKIATLREIRISSTNVNIFILTNFKTISLSEFVKSVLVFSEALHVRDVKLGDFSNDMSEFLHCCQVLYF